MKQFLTLAFLAAAFGISAAVITPSMPFKKGSATPVEGWKLSGKAALAADGSIVLPPMSAIELPGFFNAKAGDKVVYEIVCKYDRKDLSLRLGQWAQQGWIGENSGFIPAGKEFKTIKGELILTDAKTPDKAGVLRKTCRISVKIYAHGGSSGAVVKSVKLEIIPGKASAPEKK